MSFMISSSNKTHNYLQLIHIVTTLKTIIQSLRLVTGIILLLLIYSACNKTPETIGLEILDEAKLGVYDTAFSIEGYSTIEDSLRTDELSRNLVGSMQTADFGLTNTRLYSQLRLSQTSPGFEDAQPDSAVLTLVYDGYYGFINTPLTIHVYQVMQDFYKDSIYYSDTQLDLTPYTELGNLSFIPHPNDSVMNEDSTLVTAELRIPLNETFINTVMFPPDDSVYSSSNNFISYFKGIFIFTSVVTGPNEGSILYFDIKNPRSNVTLYYNDSLTFEYVINSDCASIGNYFHNYSKSQNQNFIEQVVNGDSTKGSEGLYVQGLAGTKTNLSIGSLESWVGTQKHVINEAKLVIPVVETVEELPPPVQLVLFKYNEDGDLQFINDYQEGDNYFGGFFNAETNSYEFRITLYVQSILSGVPDYGLVLYTSGKSINANEAALYGTDPENTSLPRMYLNVIYTLIE